MGPTLAAVCEQSGGCTPGTPQPPAGAAAEAPGEGSWWPPHHGPPLTVRVVVTVTPKAGRRCCRGRRRVNFPLVASTGVESCLAACSQSPGTGCRDAGLPRGPAPDPTTCCFRGFFRSQPGPPGSGLRAGVGAAARQGERGMWDGRRLPSRGWYVLAPWGSAGSPPGGSPLCSHRKGQKMVSCLSRFLASAAEVSIPGGELLGGVGGLGVGVQGPSASVGTLGGGSRAAWDGRQAPTSCSGSAPLAFSPATLAGHLGLGFCGLWAARGTLGDTGPGDSGLDPLSVSAPGGEALLGARRGRTIAWLLGCLRCGRRSWCGSAQGPCVPATLAGPFRFCSQLAEFVVSP